MTTTIDYALLAGASYFDTRAAENRFSLPQNWNVVSRIPSDPITGFEASAFTNGAQIVISYAGTDPSAGVLSGDWQTNFALINGNWSDQLLQAAEYYLQIKAANPGASITLTGHSLGGGLAALVAVFFGVQANTFDQAPFAASATALSDNASTLKNLLAAKLDASGTRLYDDNSLAGLTSYLALRTPDNPIPRANLVNTVRVDGEFLGNGVVGTVYSTIGNPPTVLTHGPYSSPSTDMHSQALLTAFLQSNQSAASSANPAQTLSEVTTKLTDLLAMLFSDSLFMRSTAPSENSEANFLDRLVRHETGIQGSFAADAMLTRFTTDLWKLAQDGGLTMSDGNPTNAQLNEVSKTLIAFAMQMYYEDTANATNPSKHLFSDVSGGIQLDLADVSKTFATAFENSDKLDLKDAKGFELYFQNYLLQSTFTDPERQLIQSMLPHLRDWYVQAGASGLASTDSLNRGAFMLGGSGSDALVGGNATDLLVGNLGADTLTGGLGNDTLIGGAGIDTYKYQTGDGLDTILDSDGQGSIVYDGATLAGGAQYGDARVHRDSDGHLYVDAGSGRLLINGDILIEGQQAGELDLTMTGAVADVNPATSLDIQGDLKPIDTNPDQAGDQYDYDALGNIIVGTTLEADRADTLYDSAGNDHIMSGGGNDILYTSRGGDNLVEAGSGRDWVHGGAGVDVVAGGADADILQGGAGNDRLYADSQVSVAQAITDGNSQSGSGQQGDWLSGNAGDDTLVGGVGNDALFGGGGADLLIGGAGDDNILGDVDWVPTSLNWSVVNGLFVPATGVAHPADYGDDVIYAGAGNDTAFGGRGNDVLFGEAGDDYLVGNGDNDALFGGAGNDTLFGDSIEIVGELEANTGDDYLDGGAGDDQLYGGAGNDILIGGTGNDTLEGGAGQDIYIFNKGDGVDTVIDTLSDNNIIRFGTGVNASDIKLRLGSLLLDMGNGDQIHIDNFDQNDVFNTVSIDSFEFADGSSLSSSELLARGFDIDGSEQDDTLVGTNITDRMHGLGGDDTLLGGGGDDFLDGSAGNDTLDGGSGNNLLMGGAGDDSYLVHTQDVIAQADPATGQWVLQTAIDDTEGKSVVRLDALQSDVTAVGADYGYGLTWSAGAGTAGVYFKDMTTAGQTAVEFADGTQVELRRLAGDTLDAPVEAYSFAPDETLFGGKQADTLAAYGSNSIISGGQGNDSIELNGQGQTVEYRRGDGLDTLGGDGRNGIIALQGNFNADGLRLEVDAQGQLSVWLGAGSGTAAAERLNLSIDRDALSQSSLISHFAFDDGSVLSFKDLLARGVQVIGTEQDDGLLGTDAADQVEGGAGNNVLMAGAGDDSYVIQSGSTNRIDDNQGANVIRLAGVTDWSAVQLGRPDAQSGDLLLTVGSDTTVTLSAALLRADKFSIELADGQSRSLGALIAGLPALAVQGDGEANVILGSDQGNAVDGGAGDDQISGGAAADWLMGGEGDDVLNGGGGDDTLFGGAGNDVFVFDANGGNDEIFDYEGNNTVRFTAGIDAAQLVAERLDGSSDVRISLDADNSVLVRRGLEGAVSTYTFADGSQWTYADLINRVASPDGQVMAGDDLDNRVDGSSGNDLLLGNRGDDVLFGYAGDDELLGGDDHDVLYGGAGNDTLDGGAGIDSFHFALGDGVDRLVDQSGASTIEFGPGISLQNLSASRESINGENYMRLAYSAGDAVLIKDGVALTGAAFQFADGTALTQDQVYAQTLAEPRILPPYTAGDDLIYGYAGNDVLQGGAGFDHLLGGKGDDELDGGADDDVLEGGAGDDTYVMGQDGGRDTVVEAGGQNSTIRLAQGDQASLSYARMGRNLLVSSTALNTAFYIPDFYAGTGNWTLKTAQGTELDLRALATQGLQDKTTEQRREDFYAGLVAKVGPMDLGDGQVLSPDGSKQFTDASGNEFSYSFSQTRSLIQSDDAVINAGADGSGVTGNSTYLRSEQRTRTYDVTDVSYTESQTVTPGRDLLFVNNPTVIIGPGGTLIVLGGIIPPGYASYVDASGRMHLVEPSSTATTRTPAYTIRTVTETYTEDLYRTEVTGQSVVEDVRGGDQANAINLSGTASKLVAAGAGDDVVVRMDSGSNDRLGDAQASPSDWVDGGAGNDQILLGAGNDELSGGGGSDYLDGGAGADTYVVPVDDDGWDTIYDSAAAVVHVELQATYYGKLEQADVDELAGLMSNEVSSYIVDPGTGETFGVRSISGDVAATVANVDALMRIRSALPTQEEALPWWPYPGGRSELLFPDLVAPVAAPLSELLNTVSDTVRFGTGISSASLQLNWGTVELNEGTKDVLLVSWGGQGGVRVVMPDADAVPGVGIEVFEFADGTRMSMAQMLALAPPRGAAQGNTVASGTAILTQEILQDHALSFTVPADAFVAPANTALNFSAKLAGSGDALPSWLVFDAMTGAFSGTPANGDVGVLNVEVTASQSATQSAKQTFALNVVNVNDAPVAAIPIASQQTDENALFSFTVSENAFADIDAGDTLTYSTTLADGSALPSWLTFDAASRTFSGTPGSGAVGSVGIEVIASDAAGASASSSFSVNVLPLPVNQTLYADTSNTPLYGGAGNDTLYGSWNSSTLIGGLGNDVLIAQGGPGNVLDGGAGDDNLTGGWGQDILLGGEGNNTIHANGGNSVISAGAGDDLITSGWGDDQITAGDGNNQINAGGGRNTITAGRGNDAIFSEWGDDTIDAGNGNNVISAGEGLNTITSGMGDDVISAQGRNVIQAGAGNDQISTGWGADDIDAGAGDDLIYAGGGGDTVRGGPGNDQIISDQWSDDRYLFARGDGQDLMLEGGGQDRLTLENVQSDQLWFSQTGNDLEVSIIGAQDRITLQNWYVGSQYPGSQYHMEAFKTSDGKTLLDSQVQNLVSAMAAFAPPAAGQTTLAANYATALSPVIAANWT